MKRITVEITGQLDVEVSDQPSEEEIAQAVAVALGPTKLAAWEVGDWSFAP